MPIGKHVSPRISFVCPEPLYTELQEQAAREGRNPSDIIRTRLEKAMKSERNQNIEQVAGIIIESGWEYDYASPEEFARKIQSGDGWGFEARYGHEGPGNFTRIEGLVLSEGDLKLALCLVEEWTNGNRYMTAADLRKAPESTLREPSVNIS